MRRTAAVIGALLAIAPGCSRPKRPNIVLISIDTLRADHLGCYGYPQDTSPVLDRLAARSTLYANALAPTPWTLPSHGALLTGVHPFRLGLLDERSTLPKSATVVAEPLSRAGYQTAAFVDSDPKGFVGAGRGFDRGFAAYRHAPFRRDGAYKYDTKATVHAAEAWLAQRDTTRPFFLFLHTKSVHTTPQDSNRRSDAPYDKPPRYLKRFLPGGRPRFLWARSARVRGVLYLRELNTRIAAGQLTGPVLSPDEIAELTALYDAGIYYVDEHIGRLLDSLDRQGLRRDTVLVITADHGEAFLEHRFLLHQEVYQQLLHVPLIVHDPRRPKGRRITDPVQLEDVAPTILRLAGLDPGGSFAGRGLPTEERPEAATPRELFAYYRFGPKQTNEAYALSDGRYKLVLSRLASGFASELYDLTRDPGERAPLRDQAGLERALLTRLEAWLRGAGKPGEVLSLDRETLEDLRALGYVQ